MAKSDAQSSSDYPTPPALGHDQQALVSALTAAILASRRDRPEASEAAKASAKQYAEIKRVLGTWAEPFPDPTGAGSKSNKG